MVKQIHTSHKPTSEIIIAFQTKAQMLVQRRYLQKHVRYQDVQIEDLLKLSVGGN